MTHYVQTSLNPNDTGVDPRPVEAQQAVSTDGSYFGSDDGVVVEGLV